MYNYTYVTTKCVKGYKKLLIIYRDNYLAQQYLR